MADLPSVSKVPEVSAPGFIDPTLVTVFDQGYELSRARYSNSKRKFTLLYHGLKKDDVVTLYNFLRDTARGSSVSFGVAYPLKETVASSTAATPIQITTSGNHGFRNGDTVITVGNSDANANGTFTISSVTATTFTLDGSSSGATGSGGTAQRKFLKMKLDLPDNEFAQIEKLIGPWSNNLGGWNVTLPLREVF
jgi:hypothetical protein